LTEDIALAGIRVILSSASCVLQRGELVLSLDLLASELVHGEEGEAVKDELLKLDAIGLLGLDSLTLVSVDVRNLLSGNVMRELV